MCVVTEDMIDLTVLLVKGRIIKSARFKFKRVKRGNCSHCRNIDDCMCVFKEVLFLSFYRAGLQIQEDIHPANAFMQSNSLALNFKLNSAYGVATDDEVYHLYETIPDVPREYEVPIKDGERQVSIEPSTNSDRSKQENHDVEGSSDYYVNDVQGSDGDSYYYVNDP